MTDFAITYSDTRTGMTKATVTGTDADTVIEQFENDHPGAVIVMVSASSKL